MNASVCVATLHRSARAQPFTSVAGLALLILLLIVGLLCGPLLAHALQHDSWFPDYFDMMDNLGHPAALWRWVVGDLSELLFYKHEFASLGLLAGAVMAYWASRQGKRWRGFELGHNTLLWPWVLLSSVLGLLLGNLLWGWTVASGPNGPVWQPTLVAFVSLPAAVVLVHGRGWRVALLGAAGGALLVTPLSLLAVGLIGRFLEWPSMVSSALGMGLGTWAGLWLLGRFPECLGPRGQCPAFGAVCGTSMAPGPRPGIAWWLRRSLADFTEGLFCANEWASLGLILGVWLAWWLNPLAPAHGSQLLPQLFGGQLLCALLAVWVWRRQWRALGWYPTYVPLVSVVPAAILLLGGSWPILLGSAVAGALIAPPLSAALIGRLPASLHRCVGSFLGMAISVLLIVPPLALLTP
jgi:hypothetical protein